MNILIRLKVGTTIPELAKIYQRLVDDKQLMEQCKEIVINPEGEKV